jgi:hypothetical protein
MTPLWNTLSLDHPPEEQWTAGTQGMVSPKSSDGVLGTRSPGPPTPETASKNWRKMRMDMLVCASINAQNIESQSQGNKNFFSRIMPGNYAGFAQSAVANVDLLAKPAGHSLDVPDSGPRRRPLVSQGGVEFESLSHFARATCSLP